MAAKHKLQVYLSDDLFELFQGFKKDSGIQKDSEAAKVLLIKILRPERNIAQANVSPEFERMALELQDMRTRLDLLEQIYRDREQENIQSLNNNHRRKSRQNGHAPIPQQKSRLSTDDDAELRGAFLLS